jgi:hypothetical protein
VTPEEYMKDIEIDENAKELDNEDEQFKMVR